MKTYTFEGKIWTREELYAEAFRLLDRINANLKLAFERCEARAEQQKAKLTP